MKDDRDLGSLGSFVMEGLLFRRFVGKDVGFALGLSTYRWSRCLRACDLSSRGISDD
jgi:hypothetical protein